ncbi:MAG: indolepyruvate/phenylpyruvate decarboxylase [Pseudomonadales bacterium]|nr:indolepyruvate/phenylpyruvate decarboxylase [Pseudomonadales bacterium]
MMTLAESLLTACKNYGAQEIFGIPGDFALPFFKVIEETEILPLYTLSHEPGVGFAADAASRLHCKPSIAAVTYGAGALNMINPIAAAYAEKSPVIVISGGPGAGERNAGLLLHHQAKTLDSQLAVFKEITCDQVVLDDPLHAPEQIARVLSNCVSQSRPVYIEIPRDSVNAPCGKVPLIHPELNVDQDALNACVDEILSSLEKAKSPMLLVGVEIRRFGLEQDVAELAINLGIPVATTFMGTGLLTNTNAPLCGTYLGAAGDQKVTEMVENSDALIMLGVILSDTNFGVSVSKINTRKSILACDGSVSMSYHTYKDIPLRALVSVLKGHRIHGREALRLEREYPGNLPADTQKITPTDIAAAVNDLFRDHGEMPIASDMGDCLFTALDMKYGGLIAPGYYATMGYGIPAGIGTQAATGQRPLILVGDGAFQMTGWELLNCNRYDWDPIVLLFNNSSWGMLSAFQGESKFNDLIELNYAEIANSLGGRGYRVSTREQLKAALSEAITRRGQFQLIDIAMERTALSKTLTQFTASVNAAKRSQSSAKYG